MSVGTRDLGHPALVQLLAFRDLVLFNFRGYARTGQVTSGKLNRDLTSFDSYIESHGLVLRIGCRDTPSTIDPARKYCQVGAPSFPRSLRKGWERVTLFEGRIDSRVPDQLPSG
jgi:hypothetical protein